jgi:hypothetical protein
MVLCRPHRVAAGNPGVKVPLIGYIRPVAQTRESFQVLSADADAARIEAHLDRLIAQMVEAAAIRGQGDAIPAPQVDHPDELVNHCGRLSVGAPSERRPEGAPAS